MAKEQDLPNCSIETKMDFTVCGEIFKIYTNHGIDHIYIDFKEAGILQPDQKHVIKTFSDATLKEEVSRRYAIDLIINNIKE